MSEIGFFKGKDGREWFEYKHTEPSRCRVGHVDADILGQFPDEYQAFLEVKEPAVKEAKKQAQPKKKSIFSKKEKGE